MVLTGYDVFGADSAGLILKVYSSPFLFIFTRGGSLTGSFVTVVKTSFLGNRRQREDGDGGGTGGGVPDQQAREETRSDQVSVLHEYR